MEEKRMEIRIGDEAPDFEGQAYHQGKIKTLRLSQYRKKWIVLFFYPGDFTYV
jgi:peroxiredoxin (alkyl hydroperoxide reductase subunit C)